MTWLELLVCSGIKLGEVYILLENSPYFDQSLFKTLNARCVSCYFNARVGSQKITDGDGKVYEYSGVEDEVVKSLGSFILNICENNKM